MSNLEAYLDTDWSAMTTSDWVGLVITVGVFLGMLITFALALRPSKREELENEKFKILDEDD